MKTVLRRMAYGFAAWLMVFAVADVAGFLGFVWVTPIIAAVMFYYLGLRCMRKKAPEFGSEGMKLGGIWFLVFAFMDFVLMPLFPDMPYREYMLSWVAYFVYAETLIIPWLTDKLTTARKKI